MAFVTLMIGNLGLVLTHRSIGNNAFRTMFLANRALAFVALMTVSALAAALTVPWLRGLFGFASLGMDQIGEAAAAAFASLIVNDLIGVGVRWLQAKR